MVVSQFLTHLKDISSSPYALIGYITVVAAWVYVAIAQSRLKNILKVIEKLPENERTSLLLKEYNTTPRSGLSAKQWIRTRRQTLFFLAVLASLLCGTILVIVAFQSKPSHREADLSLVDVLIKQTNEFPKIEVKVRNSSDEVVFLKKAEISILRQWDLPKPGVRPRAIPVSWTYDVKAPTEGIETYNISQEVKPNEVDRFEFSLGSNRSIYPYEGLFAYLIKLKLKYNENDKSLTTPPILIHIPASMKPMASTQFSPKLKELEANKNSAQNILKEINENTIIEPSVLKAVKYWAEADFSDYKP